MENGRHVVVESPDGNIFIGMNPDIEAPPVIEASTSTTPTYANLRRVSRGYSCGFMGVLVVWCVRVGGS